MSRSKAQAQAHKRVPVRHDPPIELSDVAREVWDKTLAAVGSDHFAQGDLRALAHYCQANEVLIGLHRAVMATPDDLKAVRVYRDTLGAVVSLSGKLRLVPSARNARRNGSVDPLPGGGYGDGFFGQDDGDFLGGG